MKHTPIIMLGCMTLLIATLIYVPLVHSDDVETIRIISPNGGEVIHKSSSGDEITIQWYCSSSEGEVVLYLIKGNDEMIWYLDKMAAGVQSASFDVPDYASYGSDYRIKISYGTLQDSPYDYSDGYFTIKRGFDTEAFVIIGIVAFVVIALVFLLYPRKK